MKAGRLSPAGVLRSHPAPAAPLGPDRPDVCTTAGALVPTIEHSRVGSPAREGPPAFVTVAPCRPGDTGVTSLQGRPRSVSGGTISEITITNPPTIAAGVSAPIHLTLSYGKKPIRVLIYPDGIWFAAHDIYAANRRVTDRTCLASFDPDHLRLETFPSAAGSIRLSAVTPLGVATIAKYLGPPSDRMLDGWVRRVANELADAHCLPRLELTLLADQTLPVQPKCVHSNYLPWLDLSTANPVIRQLAPDPHDPALVDDDPSLPPHDPEVPMRPLDDPRIVIPRRSTSGPSAELIAMAARIKRV